MPRTLCSIRLTGTMLAFIGLCGCDVNLIKANHPIGPVVQDDEDLVVPIAKDVADPFANQEFRQGLLAWRRPNRRGACVHCHSFDASCLARVGFAPDVIAAKATAEGASPADAEAIAKLVSYQRARFTIDAPLDPLQFRLLPRNAEIEAATTTHEKEAVLFGHLETQGLAIAKPGAITTVEQAERARDQLLNLDLRQLPTAIKFPLLSSSGIHGPEHVRIFEWLPSFATIPEPAAAKRAFEAQNAYISDPKPLTFWRAVEETLRTATARALTPIPEVLAKHARSQYRALQVIAFMLQRGSFDFPDPSAGLADVVKADREKLFNRNLVFAWAAVDSDFASTNTWTQLPPDYRAGTCEGNDCAFGDGRIDADPGSPHPGQAHLGWWWDLAAYRRSLFWLHTMMDPPGLFNTHVSGLAEQDLWSKGQMETMATHRLLVSIWRFVHRHYGADSRFFPMGDLSSIARPLDVDHPDFCRAGSFTWWSIMAARGIAMDDSLRGQRLRTMATNALRMEILLRTAYIETSGRLRESSRWLRCAEIMQNSLALFQKPEELKDLPALMSRFTAAVNSATEGGPSFVPTSDPVFVAPMRKVALPFE
ncbi:MAG: hypothetical protein SF187_05680 [Deltaproteobacteria bacterium]|nr:hypothetical protein [Deltaproteobacteria bacterium]